MVLDSIGGLVGGIAGLALASKGGGKDYKQALKVWQKLKTSDFDFTALDPPELRVLAEAMPELYEAVVPAEFREVADSLEGRGAQVEALGQYQDIAEEGLPLVDRLAREEAGRAVSSAAAAGQTDALRRLAARGQVSGGDAIQAQLAGGQQSANLARDLGSDAAQQAALRRLSGIEGAARTGTALRSGDVDVNARNAEAANRFTELFARMKTDEARDNAAARERAAAYNVKTRQEVGESNAVNRYQTALQNLARQNTLRGQQFSQQLAKTQGLAGAHQTIGGYKDAKRAAQIKAATDIGSGVGGVAEFAISPAGSLAGGAAKRGNFGDVDDRAFF